MSENLYFRRQALKSLIGGVSVLDAPKLSIRDRGQAEEFIKSYGYDWESESDRNKIYSFYRQSLAFLQDLYVESGQESPGDVFEDNKVEDVRDILVFASSRKVGQEKIQRWSCATLKVMHVMAHLNNDIYSVFEEEIRKQILDPIKASVMSDPLHGSNMLQGQNQKIKLNKFEVKPIKNQSSAIVKLLAKKRLVALNILDRVGVRFVTKNTFDIFQVIRFLQDNSLVAYPHCIVNESANTVYPTDLFLEVMDTLRSTNSMANEKEIEELLLKKIKSHKGDLDLQVKDNIFTDPDYKFVKFISRKLIRVDIELRGKKERIQFFYPFEVQVMDYQTYINNMRGPLSHEEYKKRQIKAAGLRLFGNSEPTELS